MLSVLDVGLARTFDAARLACVWPFFTDFFAGLRFFVADVLTFLAAFFARFLAAVFLLAFFALRAMVCPSDKSPSSD